MDLHLSQSWPWKTRVWFLLKMCLTFLSLKKKAKGLRYSMVYDCSVNCLLTLTHLFFIRTTWPALVFIWSTVAEVGIRASAILFSLVAKTGADPAPQRPELITNLTAKVPKEHAVTWTYIRLQSLVFWQISLFSPWGLRTSRVIQYVILYLSR